jgi:hypothetical protein
VSRILRTLTPLALWLAASACSGGWDPPPGPGPDGGLPANLVGIGVSPNDPKVTLGEELQFTATGYYSDQTTRDITDTVDWATSDSAVVEVSSSIDQEGKGVTVGAGFARVKASFFDLESNQVKVTVTEATIDELVLAPATGTLHADESLQLQAEASFSDGSRGNVSGSVRWITEDPGVATVTATGRVDAVGEGSVNIVAVYDTEDGGIEATPTSIEVVAGDVAIEAADVRLVGLSVAALGDVVRYSLEIKNSGGSPASSFWVDSWLNLSGVPPSPPTTGDAYQFVDLVEPGETKLVEIEMAGVSPGTYSSWILLDSYANIPEGGIGENNNVHGPEPVTVSADGGSIGPELSVTYLQAFVQSAQDQVLYIVDVTNTGDEASGPFSLGVYSNPDFPPAVGEAPDEALEVEAIEPGETAFLDVAVRSTPETWWTSYVLVDHDDNVLEHDETNNLASFQVVP